MRPHAALRSLLVVPLAVLVCLFALTGCASGGEDGRDTVTVGVLQMAPSALLDETVARFEAHLQELLAPRKVAFDLQNASGDQSLIASIARDFARGDHQVFAAIGTPAVVALAQQVTDRR